MNNDTDISKTLDGVDDKTLAEWWCFMNSNTNYCYWKDSIQVMDVIQVLIGHKACNREWNKDRMTDEEHDDWYSKNFKESEK